MNPLIAPFGRLTGRNLLLTLSLLSVVQEVSADAWYLRAGVARHLAAQATFVDRQCANTQPPALFGCGLGSDGNDLRADGHFAPSNAWRLGIGKSFSPYWRGEIDVISQSETPFDGRANFRNVPGEQYVTGQLSSQAIFLTGYFDPFVGAGGTVGGLQPYVGVGVGLARNHIGAMRYAFPGLSASAATLTPSGPYSNTAWRLVMGTAFQIGSHITLDLAWHYQDMGKVMTPAGEATITRSTTRAIQIDSTLASWHSRGVSLSLRHDL